MAKHLDLDEILKNEDKVYVRNMTHPIGCLGVSFVDPANGHTHNMSIPKTWVPVCVSAKIPGHIIRNSIDFRAYIAKGILQLVDPKEAEAELKSEDAIEELRRHDISNHSQLSKFSALRKDQDKQAAKVQKKKVEMSRDAYDADETEEKVNPRVKAVLSRVEYRDMDVKDAVNELKTISRELKELDVSWIIANSQGRINQWATNFLQQQVNNGTFASGNAADTPTKSEDAYAYDLDGDDSDLTPEERSREASRLAKARAQQHAGA